MGSVKDLIVNLRVAGRYGLPERLARRAMSLHKSPTNTEFGLGVWGVSGRFSVGDLKGWIPPTEIKDKAEALTMTTAAFFEWLANNYTGISTCYKGVLDQDGRVTTVDHLLQKGDKTNLIVMKLAHIPESFCDGDLTRYREALGSGELQCGVADVESIFRNGFPLGSSTFKKMCKAVGFGDRYEQVATYSDTVALLDEVRAEVGRSGVNEGLQNILTASGLREIPNPGFVLDNTVFDTTTKFEPSGDREIFEEEARRNSGLDERGYDFWAKTIFPKLAAAQNDFTSEDEEDCEPR